MDESNQLTIEQLRKRPQQYQFSKLAQGPPAPESLNTPIWLKFELEFSPHMQQHLFVLSTLTNNYSDIRIYRPNGDGTYSETITGNNFPASQRELNSAKYGFKLQPSTTAQTIYLRTTGGINTYSLPWSIIDKRLYESNANLFWAINLVSFGALLGILIFTAGIGVTLKNRNYLFYSAYVFVGSLSLINISGIGFLSLWPNSPGFNYYAKDIFNIGISATRLLTIISFLQIKELSPRLYRVSIIWLSILLFFFIAAGTVGLKYFSELLGGTIWILSALFGFFISLYAIKHKVPLARPIFIILLIPIVGSIFQGLTEVGFMDVGIVQLQLAKVTFVLHALLFSICIALQVQHEVDRRILAQHDGLTGLPSLQLAQEHFKQAIALARRYQWKLAILFIDLDGFKAVNDTHGHEIGNKLLIAVANRINDCLRDVDSVARIGGDEFLIIQTEVKSEQANTRVAEKIIETISKPFIIDGITLNIGTSIGISQFPTDGENLNDLLKLADNAMYDVKKTGKNNFSLHH